eukprot:Plantae.Rhodophyta-Hildenbrandia_rubra.ctg12759.p1 GENE.Plantae.Rhodophyta-Hildenbrandia_rubra.ctg12759~~Plantae.Rhodophyta-Hildenbrandia_rubra.ctg12759.p1  ORF type:complete len:199 (-),score=20.85 Plantae.Rhodophyta-Hildenbrandia_rubra.ctg12759:1679-2275(-)
MDNDILLNRAIVVVDMSVEQLSALQHRRTHIIANIRALLDIDCWKLKLDSRLWLHNTKESTLSLVYPEWGETMGIPNSEGASLCPELRGLGLEFVTKKHYSSFVNSKLLERLNEERIDEVYVVGINTDYCVFLTAMDSQARGEFRTFVVEDATSSVTGAQGHQEGIRRHRMHLGDEAVVSTEAVCRKHSQKSSRISFA